MRWEFSEVVLCQFTVILTWIELRKSQSSSQNWKCKDSQETSQNSKEHRTTPGWKMKVSRGILLSHFSVYKANWPVTNLISITTLFSMKSWKTKKHYRRENLFHRCKKGSSREPSTYSSSINKDLRFTTVSKTSRIKRSSISSPSHPQSWNNALKHSSVSWERIMCSWTQTVRLTTLLLRIRTWSELWRNRNLWLRWLWCKLI